MAVSDFLKKLFPKSLWVYHVNTGACNGCDIEVINVLTPYYDAERFGIKLVGSPRHADVLLVCGPVTRQVAPAVRRVYEATPAPKLVFAIGSCAAGGGIWHDSYNILGGAESVLPVDFYVPGCPPRPEAILSKGKCNNREGNTCRNRYERVKGSRAFISWLQGRKQG